MRRILSLKRHHYLQRVGIFLIAVALIVGTVSCDGTTAVKYNLTMAENPVGGGTATDLTNASPYAAGTAVSIKAVAAAGYQFVGWTAPAGGFGNPNAAQTTFTMPAQAVTVTANFAPTYALTMAVNPPGSGTATDLTNGSPYTAGTDVSIEAVAAAGYQFVNWSAPAGTFGSSTAATTTFTMPAQAVTVTANFALMPTYALTMAVNPPGSGNAIDQTNFSPYLAGTPVSIKAVDATYYQFSSWTAPAGTFVNAIAAQTTFIMPAQNVTVTANFARLYNLTVAVTPVGEGIAIDLTGASPYLAGTVVSIQAVANSTVGYQFRSWTAPAGTFANATAAQTTFTIPAQDVTVTAHFVVPQLDHFKCYDAVNATAQFILMDIEDQFCYLSYWPVFGAEWFCNPVMKNSEPIVKPDNHLTIYSIDSYGMSWHVEIVNQFGPQNLTVSGPVALAVPTWKLDPGVHEPPMYFDYFLLYEVVQGSPVDANVDLDDQFPGNAPEVNVTMPVYFANPVLHKYQQYGDESWVWDPDAHLVFYEISDNPEYYGGVNISNEFELQSFGLSETGQLLAVPSEKLYYEEIFP